MGLFDSPSVIDPRFAFEHRETVRGASLCKGVLYRVAPASSGPVDDDWEPDALDPADRIPGASVGRTAIYVGSARVQPQLGWRARKQNWKTENVTEGSVLVQLNFHDNELGTFPSIAPNDVFKVTDVATLDGVEVDAELKTFSYIVRTLTPTSNSWVRSLMCDVIVNEATDNG